MKDVLARGKQVFERELDGLEHGKAHDPTNGNDEIEAHAQAIFTGHRKQGRGNGDVGRPLKYMEKGVKRMTKGLTSDM